MLWVRLGLKYKNNSLFVFIIVLTGIIVTATSARFSFRVCIRIKGIMIPVKAELNSIIV